MQEFQKHPDAERWFYFAFQDDLLPGRMIDPANFSIAIDPPGQLECLTSLVADEDTSDPKTGEVALAGQTIRGFFVGGTNGSDYKITVTAKDDADAPETLVLEVMLRVRQK